ncbi:ATP-dependent helicase [Pseudomonas sp. GM_Psu_2]|uniref:ATP-dependent helicase n=1 Tax=unclassified Pseudomonas TaxID=196821 RepID=UPI002269BEE6|nr:ATP-dependent helicase [Pseudomonas sp. GM_Psu_2]
MALNPQQDAAVKLPIEMSGIVMAGPGSGKTTVIAHRALELLARLQPGTVLQMLTFSNKAAAEMKARVKRLGAARDIEALRFDTFHSFGMKLLKQDPQGYDLHEGFTLLNDSDVKRSIRASARAAGLPKDIAAGDRRRLNPMNWYQTWSLAKQAGYNVMNVQNRAALAGRLAAAHSLSNEEEGIALSTLLAYEVEKRRANAIDFDDLLFLPLFRVAHDEAYRDQLRAGIGAIIVDEAQDTNRIQYELCKRLALGHCGVTLVGDDDQSIYSWRGAEVSNLRRFIRDFSAIELRLEENYRSTREIVAAANRLIDNNQDRLDKTPFSNGADGCKPEFLEADDSRAMADQITQRVKQSLAAGTPASEIAVLYRTNRMAQVLESNLRRAGVDYHVVGGMSLFAHSEIVAVTSALRLARNGKDVFALHNLVPYIDAFGESSYHQVADVMSTNPTIDLHRPETLPGGSMTRKAYTALQFFLEQIHDEVVLNDTVEDFVRWCVSGPMALLDREKDEQLRERKAQRLEALVEDLSAELAERRQVEPQLTWQDILMEVALRDARQTEAGRPQITLSTLHRAKGLEYGEVHIAGVSEGLLPLEAGGETLDDDVGAQQVEEERRLAFVGVTRAKQRCTLYHADRYFFPGGNDARTYAPSRFIAELGLQPALASTLNTAYSDDSTDDEFADEFRAMFPSALRMS